MSLYADVVRFEGENLRYNELFASLHQTINDSKK